MSIPRKSPYHQILLDFLAGKYLLCVSNEVVLEYEEILTRKVGSLVANNIINGKFSIEVQKFEGFQAL